MSLPDLVEIIPLERPVHAEITVPGSKSITNRALILAVLVDGETILQGALWSEDTQVMVEALRKLGFELRVEPDPDESCNRHITVKGLGGRIPKPGTTDKPLDIFVGNAGTAARFLAPLVCLGHGVYRLHGTPRMNERPQAALFVGLRELGYPIDSQNDKLPATIYGTGPRAGRCRVSIEESSQFASGLLLCAKRGSWSVEVTGRNAEESPYVVMTSKLVGAFPTKGGTFQIEPDASSGSYFWGAGWLLKAQRAVPPHPDPLPGGEGETSGALSAVPPHPSPLPRGEGEETEISVARWPTSGWQVDAELLKVILGMAPEGPVEPGGTVLPADEVQLTVPREISRETDLG